MDFCFLIQGGIKMSINALGSGNYSQDIYSAPLTKRADKGSTPENKGVKDIPDANNVSLKNEEKLSDKAKELLERLREKYGDYDFFVGNTQEEHKSLANSGSKEFSVVITAKELEKMAADEDYAAKKEEEIESSVAMCKRINEQYGYVMAGDEDENTVGIINKITVSIGDDGKLSIFAELEKLTEAQKERIEKAKEEKAAEKKAEDKKSETVDKKNPYAKENKDAVKRTTIKASSEEELIEMLKSINWKTIGESYSGDKFDFSV